jgi:hypothetical protein
VNWPKIVDRLFLPVDASMLVYFRVVFGIVMCFGLVHRLISGAVMRDYADPPFHFYYDGFSWVRPLPGVGMQWLLIVLAVCALLLAVGLFYRLAAIVFTGGMTYVFLIDRAYYLNHEYLICLLGLLLIFLPCHALGSIDAWRRPNIRQERVPAWTLWLLRFQVALPYVFGGIAKINGDWLAGQPMRSWLPESPIPLLVGPLGSGLPAALFMSWAGMLFDLSIVPLLLWKRTRRWAMVFVVLFHLTNAVMLDIGIFPWLMIGATFVFFPAEWPRKFLNLKPVATDQSRPTLSGRPRKALVALLGIYVLLHVLLPFRHLLISGNASWTEEGHCFAWRMMLRDKNTAMQILLKDTHTGTLAPVDPRPWLTRFQLETMGQVPELQRQFAHYLADRLRDQGTTDVSIHVIAICSMNGRKPQFLTDPRVDLSKLKPSWWHREWIFPLSQPFRQKPWDVPMSQWLEKIDNCELLTEI